MKSTPWGGNLHLFAQKTYIKALYKKIPVDCPLPHSFFDAASFFLFYTKICFVFFSCHWSGKNLYLNKVSGDLNWRIDGQFELKCLAATFQKK